MKTGHILRAWGGILQGRRPLLSIEITKECPLRCPGCYAYQEGHLGQSGELRRNFDLRGRELIEGVLSLARRLRPLHVSIIGGEPLIRVRELDAILPRLAEMGIAVQVVTSAVLPIPARWAQIPNLSLVVSVDGLPPEHDRRRKPATYDRILKNIAGQSVVVHCTITAQQSRRQGYLAEFAAFWSARPEVRKIWFSLYTPQKGETSEERLSASERQSALHELAEIRGVFPKIDLPERMLEGFKRPPESPRECIFAQTTDCVTSDLATRVEPCQLGGRPDCAECGCIAAAGLAAIGRYRLGGLVRVSEIFRLSKAIGERFRPAPLRPLPAPAVTLHAGELP